MLQKPLVFAGSGSACGTKAGSASRLVGYIFVAFLTDCLLGKFCEGVPPGDGRIYDCLMRHKMEPEMSEACRDQISRRQSLAAQDYRCSLV